MKVPTLTVFTPTYNRVDTLYRVFISLQNQTCKDFEWILIDDGSTDDTDALVAKMKEEANFDFSYYKQPQNMGKHNAHNRALGLAKGNLFCIVDSDGEFELFAVTRIIELWNSFTEEDKKKYCGFYTLWRFKEGDYYATPQHYVNETTFADIVYKFKLLGDRFLTARTEVFKEFPFPSEFKGNYYPEGITWKKIGSKYKVRIFNEALYIGHYDGAGSLSREFDGWGKDTKYVIEIALDHLNNYFLYFFSAPILFCKQALYFTVFGFYMPDTIKTWKRLQPVKWFFVAPFFLVTPFVILLKKIRTKK